MILFLGCHGRQAQLDFFNKSLTALKNDKTYQEVKKDSKDTLGSWIKAGIQAAGIPPLRGPVAFKFFFNSQKSRCILLILEIDPSENATLDIIQLMFGNYVITHYFLPKVYGQRSNTINF